MTLMDIFHNFSIGFLSKRLIILIWDNNSSFNAALSTKEFNAFFS